MNDSDEVKAEEKVSVRLEVSARGHITLEMTREEFEERFPEDADISECARLEDVISDWSHVVDDLEFEIDDVELVEERSKKKRKG